MPHAPGRPKRARRAAVVDELVLQRAHLAHLIAQSAGLEVVHESATLRQLLAWLRRTPHERWPHLVVVHVGSDAESLADLGLVTAMRDAGIRMLTLSSPRARAVARRLTALKVEAIVSTADGEDELVRAARTVLAGGTVVSPRARASLRPPREAPKLSDQERRVLALYASGMTVAEAAKEMGIQHETARKYLARVRDKYTAVGRPARTKLELAEIARVDGFIDPRPS